ncbi:hypothetical protein L1887_10520 [Cichorium endivia]|nr:hypothetical protein L1887_10520 [Cichorium endivia]
MKIIHFAGLGLGSISRFSYQSSVVVIKVYNEQFLLLEQAHLLYVTVVRVTNVSWEDIGGLENVKRDLQEVAGILKDRPLWYRGID